MLSLLLTALAYGVGPVLFCYYNEVYIEEKNLRSFHIIYTVIVAAIFNVSSSLAGYGMSFSPAIIWGIIFYRINKRWNASKDWYGDWYSNVDVENTEVSAQYSDQAHSETGYQCADMEQTETSRKGKAISIRIAVIVLVIAAILVSPRLFGSDNNKNNQVPAATQITQSEQYAPQALPQTGVPIFRTHLSSDEIAPLSIATKTGGNYYVKLKHLSTGKTAMTFFIRGGETASINVPLGKYEIYYAHGDTWIGTKYLFGDDTKYYKADDVFNFYQDDNCVYGWDIELYRQSGGNLSTEEISANEF